MRRLSLCEITGSNNADHTEILASLSKAKYKSDCSALGPRMRINYIVRERRLKLFNSVRLHIFHHFIRCSFTFSLIFKCIVTWF